MQPTLALVAALIPAILVENRVIDYLWAMLDDRRHGDLPVIAIMLLIALLYGAMNLLTSPLLDDLAFYDRFYRHVRSEGFAGFIEGYAGFVKQMYEEDNIRLSNCFAVIFTLNPFTRALFVIIAAASAAAMYGIAAKVICRGAADWRVLAMVWFAGTLFLPWRDCIFVNVFYSNYVIASVILLVFYRSLAAGKTARTVLLAILLGWWHEGFSAVALGGLAVLVIRRRFHPGKLVWLSICLLFVVSMLAMTSRGMLSRATGELDNMGLLCAPGRLLMNNSLSVLLAGFIVVQVCFRRGRIELRKIFVRDDASFFAGAVAAGVLLCLFIQAAPRTSFAPQLCAVVLSGIILRNVFKPSYLVLNVLAVFAIILCVLHGVYSCYWASRFKNQDIHIMELLNESDSGTVYYDMLMPEDCPTLLTLNFPLRNLWVNWFHYKYLSEHMPDRDGRIAVVPSALSADLDSGELLDSVSGIRRCGNAMYTKKCLHRSYSDDFGSVGRTDAKVVFEDEPRKEYLMHCLSIRFSGSDGEDYYYIKILDRNKGSKRVKSIRIVKW